jgi:hypothetical protein
MEMDLTQRLPEDVLADVLRCLPPGSLAAARCVCRAWHATIDDRRLLDRDLLPLSLAGLFINFASLELTEFIYRPSTDTPISGDLHFVPTDDVGVEDICNGLVLLYSYSPTWLTPQHSAGRACPRTHQSPRGSKTSMSTTTSCLLPQYRCTTKCSCFCTPGLRLSWTPQ